MKNSIFARFARAYFIFWQFADVLFLSTTWNDLFCSCVDDMSIWWQMLIFVFLCPKRWFQFNSRVVRTQFSSITTLSNWKMIAEPRSYIFRWHSRFRRRRVCLSSLLWILRLNFIFPLTFRCVTIFSLAFSHDSLFLCASSNTETVHIFKLEAPKKEWVCEFNISIQDCKELDGVPNFDNH